MDRVVSIQQQKYKKSRKVILTIPYTIKDVYTSCILAVREITSY